MTGLPSILSGAATLLARRNTQWALIGGWAISARTEPRFTRDVDLAVAVDSDDHAQALVGDFRVAGYIPQAIVEQEAVGRLATVRMEPPAGEPGVLLDLLFASSGIEKEICNQAELIEILSGVFVPVACTEHLLALKILSRDDRTRPQDASDIRALLAVMDRDMQRKAEAALDLITSRGYNRDRDLRHLFRQALSEFSV